jgi:hypothetical protein
MSNVAVNMETKYLFKIIVLFLLDNYLKVALLSKLLFLVRNSTQSSNMTTIMHPNNDTEGFQIPHILINTVNFHLF